MGYFEKFRKSLAVDRMVEEKLYAEVAKELEKGIRRDGLWAKAVAKSQGIESKAKALYLEYRVQAIKDDIEIAELGYQKEKELLSIDIQIKQNCGNRRYVTDKNANKQIEMIAYMCSIGMTTKDMLDFFKRNTISCLVKEGWNEKIINKIIHDFKLAKS